MTEYGVTRSFAGVIYGNSGFSSREAALENVYRRAFENGHWKPRTLRQKWWQFWRPVEHDWIERLFVDEDT